MNAPTDFRKLSDDEWREFQRRADRFADAVNSGGSLSWMTHLDGLTGNLRTAVLHEFIKIDLDASWKKGIRIFLDDYMRRMPELGSPYDLPAHLVYEEYRVRKAYGDTPESDIYLSRYPHLAETLRGFFGGPTDKTRRDEGRPTNRSVDQSVAIPKDDPDPGSQSMLPAVGQYQLLEMLGKGQFGEVWRAKAPGGVEVAVKVISQPSDRETARRELQALELVKNLRHPTLMATLAFWEHQQKVYIVVELAEGTLRDRMKKCKDEGKEGIPPEELVTYIESAAAGLDFLHSKNVFHRDVKPDNILLASGHAKVADFGLARAQDRPDMSVSFAGTPVYMAPEVWGGKFSAKSDQYSLAITYAELRLGRRPLDGKDFVELMSQQLEAPPDLKGLPPAEKAVLARGLAKQPDKRHGSCREFADALFEAIHGPAGGGGGGTGRKINPVFVLVGVAVLVVAVMAVYFGMTGGKTDPTSPATELAKTNGSGNGEVKQGPGNGDHGGQKPKDPPIQNDKKDPPPPRLPVPAGFQAVGPEAKKIGNAEYPVTIEFMAAAGNSDLVPRFVLVETAPGKAVYVLDTKVWNGLMAWAAGPGNEWAGLPADQVAVKVSLKEAIEAAKKLGGRLPTPAEWDAAAGYPIRQGSPGLVKNHDTASPVIKTDRPGRVNNPNRDVSTAGVSNMTGNGRELTAAVVKGEGWEKLPDPVPTGKEVIVLRGRNFTLAEPLKAIDLDDEQKVPQVQYAEAKSKYTGFRVVVDLP